MGIFADTVYHNGTIVTMNDELKFAEAVAVSGNIILAVGDFAKVKTVVHEKTRYVDLKGKTLLPGFIDAHSPYTGYGISRFVGGCEQRSIGNYCEDCGCYSAVEGKSANYPKG